MTQLLLAAASMLAGAMFVFHVLPKLIFRHGLKLPGELRCNDPKCQDCVSPPFRPIVLPPTLAEAYAQRGVPIEHIPLGHAPVSACPLGTLPGDLVVDATGRWCMAFKETPRCS